MKKSSIVLLASSIVLMSLSSCSGNGHFTVKWNNYDGTTIELDANVKKGDTPTYNSKTPYRVDDSSHYYVFKGWDKEVAPIKKDTTYTATYNEYDLTNISEDPDGYVDNLPNKTGESNIFHAFCWTFKDIEDKLPDLVNAGFKAVQTSPVQQPKSGGSSWWAYYQPLSFSIASESKLGTKADFLSLCHSADELGVSIIVDVVFNHMANIKDGDLETDGTPVVFPGVNDYEPEIYAHRNDSENPTFHHNPHAEGSGSITQVYQYGDLPDLNTANPLVQQRCLDFLKECIDAGVDGFRFDAAKHIETPEDPQYASDFWPNTLGVAKQYYKDKTGNDLFAYGEILDGPGGGRDISIYAKLMAVTDNAYGNIVKNSLGGNGKNAASNYVLKTEASNLVTWIESHDTYTTDDSHIINERALQGYAITATRPGSRSLFLSRPDSAFSVGIINDYEFENNTLGAINRFHNRFANATEYVSSDGTLYINQLVNENGDAGAVVVDLDRTKNSYVHLDKLGTGVYYDQATGQSYTVRDGHLTFEMPMSGILLLTKSKNLVRPTLTIDNRGGLFLDKLDITLRASNGVGTYSFNNGSPVSFEGKKVLEDLQNSADGDGVVILSVTVTNDQFSITRHFKYQKIQLIPGYFNVVNVNPDYYTTYDLWIWSWKATENGKWSQDYTIQDGIVLVDVTNLAGFVLGVFNKGYDIPNKNEWDHNVLKQTIDIKNDLLTQGYYDATNF